MTETASLAAALAIVQAKLPVVHKGSSAKVKTKSGAEYGYCLAPDTPVLTADLRWVEAQKITEGDHLAGFDEERPAHHDRRWRDAVVEAAGTVALPAYRIGLADGTEIVASAMHRWLTINSSQVYQWTDTQSLRTPDHKRSKRSNPSRLTRVVDVWDEMNSRESGYLAAAFDGEGSLCQTLMARAGRVETFQMHCGFSQRDNEMRAYVEAQLAAFGFSTSRAGGGGTNRNVSQVLIAGGRREVLRFLGSVRPERLLPRLDLNRVGRLTCADAVDVVSLTPLGVRSLVSMQTSTRTLIANGFASHNSYANLADIAPAVYPLLGDVGLAFICLPTLRNNTYVLVGRLEHTSGECRSGIFPLPTDTDPQTLGSAMTYGRRYLLGCLTGVVTGDEDDDGAQATRVARGQQARAGRAQPAARAARPAETPGAAADDLAARKAAVVRAGQELGWSIADLKREYESAHDGKLSDASAEDLGLFEQELWSMAEHDTPEPAEP